MSDYNEGTLRAEINAVLDRLHAGHWELRPKWVAQEVCKSHDAGLRADDGEDVAFWRYAGYTHARKLATDCINERAGPRKVPQAEEDEEEEPSTPTQGLLPYDGFPRKYLRDYYVVTRQGEDVGVPTRTLSDDELEAKAVEYRKKSRTLARHADEIVRYVRWRLAEGIA